MLIYNIKTFPQLSYQASGSQAIHSTNGTDVYQPIKGAFLIHTRSGGLQNGTTQVFDIPINNYANGPSHRHTNIEVTIVNANATTGGSGVTSYLTRIFSTRSGTGEYSSTSFDVYRNSGPTYSYTDTWQSMLVYDNTQSKFILRLVMQTPGGGIITTVGLYKGMFKIF